MASIVFRPTCSSCKKILESAKIDMEEEEVPYYIDSLKARIKTRDYFISPCKCPYCGAIFTNVISPGAMHFPISDDTLMSHAATIKEEQKMENQVTVYSKPKNYKILSYQEVRDRVKTFDSSSCCGIWVFDGFISGGKNLLDFELNKLFTILSHKCGENYMFVERIIQ